MASLFMSSRLSFRPWQGTDLDYLAAMNADPRVMQYFPSTQDRHKSESFIHRNQRCMSDYGYCYYVVETIADQEFIGFIGLSYTDYNLEFTPCTEIGWRLRYSAWGRGYATEGGRAVLSYAHNKLNISEILSWTAIINKPSEKVMQKIGMTYVTTFDHPLIDKGHPLENHVLYKKEIGLRQ